MQKENFEITLARREDIDAILALYENAKQYMRENGNPNQWNSTYPERQLLLDDIAKRQLYVCKENGEIHGVFALIIGKDVTYSYIEDGEWLNEEPYGTIHRLASDGKTKGTFRRCLTFCLKHCGNLRADTHHDNQIMQYLLEKYGFRRCGIIYLQNGAARIAYQYDKDAF